ncbi:MAG: hypothetical protein O6761_04355 [Thaumarchaeota archaeon]|nr:hypothetical protein [Nitrososphaerota archaeon]
MAYVKRGFLEIISVMLSTMSGGPLRKTHITFKCNLDSRAVGKYLRILNEHHLVRRSKENVSFYEITSRGRDYVTKYSQLLDILGSDETKIYSNLELSLKS